MEEPARSGATSDLERQASSLVASGLEADASRLRVAAEGPQRKAGLIDLDDPDPAPHDAADPDREFVAHFQSPRSASLPIECDRLARREFDEA